ncbi:MAG: TetR/AcrR family transcriptional regulator [Actinomycetota bacterium]
MDNAAEMTQVEDTQGSDPLSDGRSQRRYDNGQRLYDAADALFRSTDYDDVSVDDICAAAGVGRATFFRIYGTKAGLLRELNRRLAADAAARLDPLDDATLEVALDAIRSAVVAAWGDAGPGHYRMAADYLRHLPLDDPHGAHPELLEMVTERVERAIASGETGNDLPADVTARSALVTMLMPFAEAFSGGTVDLDAVSRVLLRRWCAGARSDLG